jgi:hypothetical protein
MPFNRKVDADAVLARVLREGPDALLTRGEAAALLAARVKDPHDSDRTARNRIGTMLDRASERGGAAHGGGLARLPDGRYTVDEIAYWTISNFPWQFMDLPFRPRAANASTHDGISMFDFAECESTPGDLGGCLALVKELRAQIGELQADQRRAVAAYKRQLADNLKGKQYE